MATLHTYKALTFDDVLIRPGESNIEPREANLSSEVIKGITLPLPFLSAAMDRVTETSMAIKLGMLGGLGVLHRNCNIEVQADMVRDIKKANVLAAAACGPFDTKRAQALQVAGCDVIVIDCAHGHNKKVIAAARQIKETTKTNMKVVVGNIATAEAAKALCDFADAIKVGVGPGSICTTRIVSGVGMPQLSAIMEVYDIAKQYNVPVIADGGIKTSGDAAKAFAAGASGIMLGNFFAGTDEAPGNTIERDGVTYKEYRGMGSKAVLETGVSADRYLQKGIRPVAEGVEGLVPCKGPVEGVVQSLASGIQIAMGYVGASTLPALREKAVFIEITTSGMTESKPHSIVT